MNVRLTPLLYLRITWQLEIIVAATLVVFSDVARIAVILPYFLLAFLLVSPYAGRIRQHRRLLTLILSGTIAISTLERILVVRSVENVISLLIELAIGALPLLLLQDNARRSYWLATLNIAIVAVSSISLASGSAVYVGFIGFMIILLFNLNAAHLSLPDEAGRRFGEALPFAYFRQFFYVLPVGLLSAALIFVLFPRARSLSFSFGFGVKSKTGYSGGIELAGGGEIEPSQDLAFLADGSDPTWAQKREATALFRGDTLDTFDGSKWSRASDEMQENEAFSDLRISSNHAASPYAVTIYREPSSVSTLFYPGVLVDVGGPANGLGGVRYDRAGTITKKAVAFSPYEYTVRVADVLPWPEVAKRPLTSAAERVAPGKSETLRQLTPEEREKYLAIPDVVAQAEYFKSWLSNVGVDRQRTSLADATSTLKQHFAEHFQATLANQFSDQDAFQEFLAKDRRGHCEYFATATALFYRSLGVPSRVVIGYKGGGVNRLVGLLEVREANAHAWTEVYLPRTGWQPVDLMPPSNDAVATSSDFRQFINAASYLFRQYVVDYNFESQQSLFLSLADITRREQTKTDFWREWFERYRSAVVAGVLLILAGGWLLRRRRAAAALPELPAYYLRFQKAMAKQGKLRHGGETYARYHRRLVAEGVAAEQVHDVDRRLEQDLYGSG